MNIINATKQALNLNTGFCREIYNDEVIVVIPLNEPFWCLLIIMPKKFLNKRPESVNEWKEVHLCGGWNPTAEDLLSEDWKILDKATLNDLSDKGNIIQQDSWEWEEIKNEN